MIFVLQCCAAVMCWCWCDQMCACVLCALCRASTSPPAIDLQGNSCAPPLIHVCCVVATCCCYTVSLCPSLPPPCTDGGDADSDFEADDD